MSRRTPSNQLHEQGLIGAISAMKDGARLAQSLGQQDTEKIGIFKDFSSVRKADSRPSKKRDSAVETASLGPPRPGTIHPGPEAVVSLNSRLILIDLQRHHLARRRDHQSPGIVGREFDGVIAHGAASDLHRVSIFAGRQIERWPFCLRTARAGCHLDGLLVDGEGSLAVAKVSEHQLRLSRLRQDVRQSGGGRDLLGEIDGGLAIVTTEFEDRRPVGS